MHESFASEDFPAARRVSRTRVLIADDHALIRQGIGMLLGRMRDVEVIGEAADGGDAIELASQLRPDVAILDVRMRPIGGIEAAAGIKLRLPATRIIMLSMHAEEEFVSAAMHAGAHAYVVKDAAPTELEIALRAVLAGGCYLSPRACEHLLKRFLQRPEETASLLTARQREVLQLISEGNAPKVIARQLALSVKTVNAHKAEVMRRLDIRGTAGLVSYGMRNGLNRS
jgi:DNA-binding NarL/FixJ family response regulator